MVVTPRHLPTAQHVADKSLGFLRQRQIVAIGDHEALRAIERRQTVLLAEVERVVARCAARENVARRGDSAAGFGAVDVGEDCCSTCRTLGATGRW